MTSTTTRDLILTAPLKNRGTKARLTELVAQMDTEQLQRVLTMLEGADMRDYKNRQIAQVVSARLMGGVAK